MKCGALSLLFAALVWTLCLFTAAGCGGLGPTAPLHPHKAPPELPLDSVGWYQEFIAFPGMYVGSDHPTAADCPIGELCEELPDRETGRFASYLLYLQQGWFTDGLAPDPTEYFPSLTGYATLAITVQMNAPPGVIFRFDSEPANTCQTPAHVRAYIHYRDGTNSRWWSHSPGSTDEIPDTAAFLLVPGGSATVTVPLEPKYWVNVDGQAGDSSPMATEYFAKSLANPQYIGLTFGGGCFYAHGVACEGGPCEFRLTNYSFR